MDGVLVNTEHMYLDEFEKFIRLHNLNATKEDLKVLIGAGPRQGYDELVKRTDIDWDFETWSKKIKEYSSEIKFDYKNSLNSGVIPLLSYLKENNYNIALASSTEYKLITHILKVTGIQEFFQHVLSGRDLKETKPHPEIYLKCASGLGVRPEECVAVEDSTYGVLSALRAGMTVIAKKDESFDFDLSNAHYKVSSMAEVRGILDNIKNNC